MKIRIEIDDVTYRRTSFDDWLDRITEELHEWTEKYTFNKEENSWIIEIEGE